MNKKLVKRCYLILIRFISFLLSLFAVYVGCYAVISLGVFKQYIFPINYLFSLIVLVIAAATNKQTAPTRNAYSQW